LAAERPTRYIRIRITLSTCDIKSQANLIEKRRDIPPPSKPKKGQKTVRLPPQIAMKLSIYQGMRDQGITQATMGECIELMDARFAAFWISITIPAYLNLFAR
jgi:hypothetical protein